MGKLQGSRARARNNKDNNLAAANIEALTRPTLATAFFGALTLLVCAVTGHVREILSRWFWGTSLATARKGYAPIRDPLLGFFMQRIYARAQECYNRPIASAPGAWVDVMERRNTTGTRALVEFVPTGRTQRCLNLASYNYLGFAAADPHCTPRAIDSIQQLGVSACSPRVAAGTTSVHVECEALVARYLGVEAAITYGMGFATNSTTIPALVGPGCLILSDSLNHASIVSGARLSGAKVQVFRHNDPAHLEQLLRRSIAEGQPRLRRGWRKVLVIVEGIYSMEGEVVNLAEIVKVAKRYKAYVYLDEAHSIGAMGKTGRGVCEHCGVDPRDVDVLMGTFTKSFGSCGGYIAGRRELIEHIRRHSPGHLYACSMAPGAAQQVTSSLEVMMGLDGTDRGRVKVKQLHDNANYVRRRLLDMGLSVVGSWDSPVAGILTYNPAAKYLFGRETLKRGLACVVVGFPATTMLMTRARLCISAAHTREELDWALEQIEEVADMVLIRYRNKALKKHVLEELKVFLDKDAAATEAVAAACNSPRVRVGAEAAQQQPAERPMSPLSWVCALAAAAAATAGAAAGLASAERPPSGKRPYVRATGASASAAVVAKRHRGSSSSSSSCLLPSAVATMATAAIIPI